VRAVERVIPPGGMDGTRVGRVRVVTMTATRSGLQGVVVRARRGNVNRAYDCLLLRFIANMAFGPLFFPNSRRWRRMSTFASALWPRPVGERGYRDYGRTVGRKSIAGNDPVRGRRPRTFLMGLLRHYDLFSDRNLGAGCCWWALRFLTGFYR